MPYLSKKELKSVLMSAFNSGVIAGVSIDHKKNTPEEIFNTFDFDSFYSKRFLKENEHHKSKANE